MVSLSPSLCNKQEKNQVLVHRIGHVQFTFELLNALNNFDHSELDREMIQQGYWFKEQRALSINEL